MSDYRTDEFIHEDIAIEHAKPELAEPRKYKVLLLNDDYTPMEFVVDVLKFYFYLTEEQAVQVMLQVHQKGKAICGVFTRDIAETKVVQVNDYARSNQHPLMCSMEADE